MTTNHILQAIHAFSTAYAALPEMRKLHISRAPTLYYNTLYVATCAILQANAIVSLKVSPQTTTGILIYSVGHKAKKAYLKACAACYPEQLMEAHTAIHLTARGMAGLGRHITQG